MINKRDSKEGCTKMGDSKKGCTKMGDTKKGCTKMLIKVIMSFHTLMRYISLFTNIKCQFVVTLCKFKVMKSKTPITCTTGHIHVHVLYFVYFFLLFVLIVFKL